MMEIRKLSFDPRLPANPTPNVDYLTRQNIRLTELLREQANTINRIIDEMGLIQFKDSANLDAFGRLRTSHPQTIFDSQHEYTGHPLIWESVTSGTGTVTHSATTGEVTVSTGGTAAGARAMRRTKVYWRYQPGKSQLVKLTGVPLSAGTHAGASSTSAGYYDDRNGVGFGTDATGNYFFVRSDVSGSVVDTKVYSSSWNIDKFNAKGPSAETLNNAKLQIIVIDLQWLGSGRVRCGFQIDGQTFYAHEFVHANNTLSDPYMKTANLPLTYEAVNTGGTGANVSIQQICGCIESEGGVSEDSAYNWFASMDATTRSCPASSPLTPLITLRLRDTFNGVTYRGHVHMAHIDFLNTSGNPALYQVIWNGTVTLSGAVATTTNVDATHSGVEFDTYSGGTPTIAGGQLIGGGYISAGLGGSDPVQRASLVERLILARTYAGTRDTVTIAARGIGGAATIAAGTEFSEQY